LFHYQGFLIKKSVSRFVISSDILQGFVGGDVKVKKVSSKGRDNNVECSNVGSNNVGSNNVGSNNVGSNNVGSNNVGFNNIGSNNTDSNNAD
jgi:hypothetical protein